jgi:transposase
LRLRAPAYEHPQRYLAVGEGTNDSTEGEEPVGSYAGVDWASAEHAVCVVDEHGRRLLERTVAHDELGLSELCRALRRLGVCRVALERPDGLVVERLLGAGLAVVAIHPNQVRAARERYTVSGGKSDRFDAYVLAELGRTDMHRLRVLCPDSDETKALRALTRAREDLVEARVSLANQLRDTLERFWPGAAAIFAEVDSPICLAFLERYPSPTDARGLGEQRLAAFLSRHAYCGRRAPAELLRRLRSAPRGGAHGLESDARRAVVVGLVACLRPLVEQIAQLTSQIAGAVRAHPDGEIFLSLFRDPKTSICPATLLAEIGDSRARYPSDDLLAAHAGMSPVAIESGKRKVASFRWGCDKRLRDAVACLADATRHWHPWAQAVYRRARARGQDHPHATRTLGRAWLRILWRMWQDRTPYDPARHRALAHQSPQGG